MQYFTEDYFKEVERRLSEDPEWQEATKGVKTSILLCATDRNESFVLKVEDGKTTIGRAEAGAQQEFSFEGNYETWTKVAKGDVDLQSAVLKGLLRFRGSITKILVHKERFTRMVAVARSVPLEF